MITKMSHDWEAAVVTIRYDNATLTGADEAKAFAFLRAAVDTQHAKAGGSFELRVQWILEPRPRTLRDEVIAAVESVPVSHVDRNRVANAGDFADAVLPAVKASLDALPMTPVRLGEDHLIAGQFTQTTKRDDIDALFGNDRTPNGGAS